MHNAYSRACTGDRADCGTLRSFSSRALSVLGLLRSHRRRIDTRLLFRQAVALVFVWRDSNA